MQVRYSKFKAFSFVEILVAIAVLAIVAAIIVPKFLNIQSQTNDTVAQQIQSELNITYANWKGSGGTIIGTPYGSLILGLLSAPAVVAGDSVSALRSPFASTGGDSVVDGGISSNISIDLPRGTPNLNPSAGGIAPTNLVESTDYAISFTGDSFMVFPRQGFDSLNWGLASVPGSPTYFNDIPPSSPITIVLPAAQEVSFSAVPSTNPIVFYTADSSAYYQTAINFSTGDGAWSAVETYLFIPR